jgi:hypothetical protein
MASTIETSAVQEILKDKYGEYYDLIPKFAICRQNMGGLQEAQKFGRKFVTAVTLQLPHGHTLNGATATYGSSFALNDSAAGRTEQAELAGTEYINRDFISYGLISSSKNGDLSAFKAGLDLVVQNLNTSSGYMLELMTLYGGRWMGEVSGATFSDPAPANSGANDIVVYVTKREWAAGIWSLAVGQLVDVYAVTGTYPNTALGTIRNTTGTVTVKSVDGSIRKLTLTFSVAGERAAVVETDCIVPRGAKDNWSLGIAQTAVTSSYLGTLYTIDCSLYPMFQASRTSQTGTATWAKIVSTAAQMTARGGMRDYTVLSSPWTFNDINNDQAALRQYQNDYGGKFVNGADGSRDSTLVYNGPNGTLTVVSHPMVKAGEVFLLDWSTWKYVGSSMPTFNLPGQPEWFLQQQPDNAGSQLRQWWDLAPMCMAPAALGFVYGFTPSGLT